MYKVAISGKANSGKDTLAKILWSILKEKLPYNEAYTSKRVEAVKKVALADPIKEMIMLMFPRTSKKTLYGPSKYRSMEIPGAFKCGIPATYRTLLQDLGTEVGRGYKEDIWMDVVDYKMEKAQKKGCSLFMITDVRFRNEFEHFKALGYTMIRIKRDLESNMNHSSEIEQESILDDEFDFVILNNGSMDELKDKTIYVANNMVL